MSLGKDTGIKVRFRTKAQISSLPGSSDGVCGWGSSLMAVDHRRKGERRKDRIGECTGPRDGSQRTQGYPGLVAYSLCVFQQFTLSQTPGSSSVDQRLDRSSLWTFRIPQAHTQTQGFPVLTWEKPAWLGCGQ